MTAVVCRVVELCAFRFVRDRVQYLLLRRAADEPVHPGIWQIVTGTMEEGESAHAAALRELREETGFRPERFWVVPYTNSLYDPRRDEVYLIPFFAAQVRPGDEPGLSEEHSSYEWLAYREARRRLVWPGQRNGLDIVHRSILGGEEAARLVAMPP